MIFVWLIRGWRRITWLFIAPESPLPWIDPNAPCPVCGNRLGDLLAVPNGATVLCRHTCRRCGARWHEQPVVKAEPDMVWPAGAAEMFHLHEPAPLEKS